MIGTTFDLKPCYSCSTRLDRWSQLIQVEPNVLMYPNGVSHVTNYLQESVDKTKSQKSFKMFTIKRIAIR